MFQMCVCCSHTPFSPYSFYFVALKVPWKPYGMLTGTTALPSSWNVLASKTRRNVLLSWKSWKYQGKYLMFETHLSHPKSFNCIGNFEIDWPYLGWWPRTRRPHHPPLWLQVRAQTLALRDRDRAPPRPTRKYNPVSLNWLQAEC